MHSAYHGTAEFGEFGRHQRRAGMMRSDAAMFRREAESHRHVEVAQRIHLPVEPSQAFGGTLSAQDKPVRR